MIRSVAAKRKVNGPERCRALRHTLMMCVCLSGVFSRSLFATVVNKPQAIQAERHGLRLNEARIRIRYARAVVKNILPPRSGDLSIARGIAGYRGPRSGYLVASDMTVSR